MGTGQSHTEIKEKPGPSARSNLVYIEGCGRLVLFHMEQSSWVEKGREVL